MAKANITTNTIDRRGFLIRAASATVLVAAANPVAAEADPIHEAIEQHKAAAANLRKNIDDHCHLENAIPREKRRSSVDAFQVNIVEADDPRWIASERAVAASFEAESDAACALVNVLPTTPAGVIAVLQYAVAADVDGETWPDLYQDAGAKRGRPWHHFLIANLAGVLPAMVSA